MNAKAAAPANGRNSKRHRSRPRLRIVATRGSITQVIAPAIVVGSYRGIAPTSALKALDDATGNWISRAGEQGMIGGLGEMFFVPVPHKEIATEMILLAGMGDYGKFNYNDLRYLAMNICYAVSALKLGSFASVLIGSGEGSLDIEEAVKGLLSGFCDALHRVPRVERVVEFKLVEHDEDRYASIVRILKDLKKNRVIENLSLALAEETLPPLPAEQTVRASHNQSSGAQPAASRFVNRITIERSEESYSFSALTNSAVIPVRKVEVQRFFTEGITAQLKKGESLEKFGLLLHK